MSFGPGWYDDPDDAKAERYWDGQNWSPNRRRKQAPPIPRESASPPPTYYPVAPPQHADASSSLPYPDQSAQYPAYGFDAAPPTPSAQRRESTNGAPNGFDASFIGVVGPLIAFCGVGLVISAFLTWGKARAAGTFVGMDASWSVTYPGVGDPTQRGSLSDRDGTVVLSPNEVIDTTNPGWVAIVLGVVAIALGAAYHTTRRREFTAASALCGIVAFAFCANYLADVRDAFGDPARFVTIDFAAGFGLWAATGLTVILVVVSVAAFFSQRPNG
ncbi:hypothetical protein FHR72_001100 [Mycolicibacterium iranicum]|uniref:DUF2510 domain-containing protein n=2 Tax=Mycolicibacterium iranicum TaxID=912594 RepID=A0A839Q1Q0_MYCIR|nr:hypothetical protein [Mycolicibacterium iranicum]